MTQRLKTNTFMFFVFINGYLNHSNTRLSIDFFDLNSCVLLSVTVFLMVSSFSFILVNDYFFCFSVSNYRSCNSVSYTHLDVYKRQAWEEPFGPVLPIIRVKTVDEAIEMSNQSEYGLQASIFSQDIDQAFTIAEKIQAGSVQINGRTERGPDHFPFIGTKGSGMGTQGVRRSIESMTREKVTVININ